MDNYKVKYLKYKTKYLNLKKQLGSGCTNPGWWDSIETQKPMISLNEKITIEDLKNNIELAEAELNKRKESKYPFSCHKKELMELIIKAKAKLESKEVLERNRVQREKQAAKQAAEAIELEKNNKIIRDFFNIQINKIIDKIMEDKTPIEDCDSLKESYNNKTEAFIESMKSLRTGLYYDKLTDLNNITDINSVKDILSVKDNELISNSPFYFFFKTLENNDPQNFMNPKKYKPKPDRIASYDKFWELLKSHLKIVKCKIM
jgi:hypothetical protein